MLSGLPSLIATLKEAPHGRYIRARTASNESMRMPTRRSGNRRATNSDWNSLAAILLDSTKASEVDGMAPLFGTNDPLIRGVQPIENIHDSVVVGQTAGLSDVDCEENAVRRVVRASAKRAWMELLSNNSLLAKAVSKMEGVVTGSDVLSTATKGD